MLEEGRKKLTHLYSKAVSAAFIKELDEMLVRGGSLNLKLQGAAKIGF